MSGCALFARTFEVMTDLDREEHEDLEDLLRRARCMPPDAVVERLERRLFPAQRRAPARWRPLKAAFGTALGAGALLFGMSLAGEGLLSPDTEVSATDSCTEVMVTKQVRKPFLVRGRDGELSIVYRSVPERRPVTRCR